MLAASSTFWGFVAAELQDGELTQPHRVLVLFPGAAKRGPISEGMTVSKERIEGAAQKGVGAVKEGAGKLVGNEKLQAEGVADKMIGSGKETVGKAKDAIHRATK
jgi:uncharacterized protein YjbJ (UPF0337 family)